MSKPIQTPKTKGNGKLTPQTSSANVACSSAAQSGPTMQWSDLVKKSTTTQLPPNKMPSQSLGPASPSEMTDEGPKVKWNEVFRSSDILPPGQKRKPKRSTISVAEAVVFRVVKKTGHTTPMISEKTASKLNTIQPPPNRKNASKAGNILVNPATGAAIERRGKEKINTRPPKPSKLKMAILEEREDIHGMAASSSGVPTPISAASMAHQLPKDPSNEQPNSPKSGEISPNFAKFGSRTVELKTERDHRIAHLRSLKKPSDSQNGSHKSRSTSNLFPLLFHNLITPELNDLTEEMLKKLAVFHYRAQALKAKKPSKAKRGMRFVAGLSQCLRSVALKRAKMVLLAPNMEESESEGGLEAMILRTAQLSKIHHIPLLFVLNRRKLASCINVHVRVTAIAIVNADGANEEFTRLQTLANTNSLLSAFKYKKEVDDALLLSQTISQKSIDSSFAPTEATDSDIENENAKQAFSPLPRIDRFALVDSTNPNKIIAFLGPEPGPNPPDATGDTNHHSVRLDMASLCRLSSSWDKSSQTMDLPTSLCTERQLQPETLQTSSGHYIAKISQPKLSIRCLTSSPYVGSLKWDARVHKRPEKHILEASSFQDSVHASQSSDAFTLPTLTSHHSPFVMRTRQGKFVRNLVIGSQSLSTGSNGGRLGNDELFGKENEVEMSIEASLYSEFGENGVELSRASLHLTLVWPNQMDDQTHDISFDGDGSDLDCEEMKVDDMVAAVLDAEPSSESSDSDSDLDDPDGDHRVERPLEATASTLPTKPVKTALVPDGGVSSTAAWEEMVLEEDARRKERKKQRKEAAKRKRRFLAQKTSEWASRNAVNRLRHEKGAPLDRPSLEEEEEAKEAKKISKPPFCSSFSLPLSELLPMWMEIRSSLSKNNSLTIGHPKSPTKTILFFVQLSHVALSLSPYTESEKKGVKARKNSGEANRISISSHLDASLPSTPTQLIELPTTSAIIDLIKEVAKAFQLKPKNTHLFLCGIPLSHPLLSSTLPTLNEPETQKPSASSPTNWIQRPIESIPFLSDGASLCVHPTK
jgi:selenocysteine insertion sequence-binding protein 2